MPLDTKYDHARRWGYRNRTEYITALARTHQYIKLCCNREKYCSDGNDLAAEELYIALKKVNSCVRKAIINNEKIDFITAVGAFRGSGRIREQFVYFLFILRTLRHAGLPYPDHNDPIERETIDHFMKRLPKKQKCRTGTWRTGLQYI
ncbi:hypothetical protein [Leptospira santarosai]|uniref:hypothetical protein n=1 Tax=Leptospira santarosai TaxID=28183 RepID=UPI0024AFF137|nr:hypothetical protein [Leptospira santarosai]MDI7226548.1 hypothetical protein [Leptospira santarosai]